MRNYCQLLSGLANIKEKRPGSCSLAGEAFVYSSRNNGEPALPSALIRVLMRRCAMGDGLSVELAVFLLTGVAERFILCPPLQSETWFPPLCRLCWIPQKKNTRPGSVTMASALKTAFVLFFAFSLFLLRSLCFQCFLVRLATKGMRRDCQAWKFSERKHHSRVERFNDLCGSIFRLAAALCETVC